MGLGVGHGNTTGVTAASLGSLNASHAAPAAFANASPNSVVGQLAGYATALNNSNLAAAAQALAQAAHSPAPLSASSVMAVNTNLNNAGLLSATGLAFGTTNATAIATQSNLDR